MSTTIDRKPTVIIIHRTPYGTYRVWIPKNLFMRQESIWMGGHCYRVSPQLDLAQLFMKTISVWHGMDKEDDFYYSWELDGSWDAATLSRMVEMMMRRGSNAEGIGDLTIEVKEMI